MRNETNFTREEIITIHKFIDSVLKSNITDAIKLLDLLKDRIYLSIPEKQRQSRGITWVLNRIASSIINYGDRLNLLETGLALFERMQRDSFLLGIPVFLAAEYGVSRPDESSDFFLTAADSESWVIKEFAAIGYRKIIRANKKICHDFLLENSMNNNPNVRRFVSETLRPVVENNWIHGEPDYSLSILRNMFMEKEEFPRTSVGNNLSDLSKKSSELIFRIVEELMGYANKNSCWIAYRACRNLVKIHPERVMDILGVDEYHYKDRNFYRNKL